MENYSLNNLFVYAAHYFIFYLSLMLSNSIRILSMLAFPFANPRILNWFESQWFRLDPSVQTMKSKRNLTEFISIGYEMNRMNRSQNKAYISGHIDIGFGCLICQIFNDQFRMTIDNKVMLRFLSSEFKRINIINFLNLLIK